MANGNNINVELIDDDARFAIRATVSGGVTGYNSALCKKNGKTLIFETRAEAEKLAAQYRREMGGGSTTGARYSYVVEEV